MKRRIDYTEYISSPQWQAKRQQYLASHMPQDCQGCGTKWSSGFHFHHKTYKRLGNERLHDIVPVCQRCHSLIHASHMPGKSLWSTINRILKRERKKAQKDVVSGKNDQ